MARRSSLVLGFWLFAVLSGEAQTTRVWVEFRDKPRVALNAAALGISPRALARRAKVLPPDRLLDEADRPVSPEYLRALAAAGAHVRSVSRWLNAASVELFSADLPALATVSGVRAIRPLVTTRRKPLPIAPPSLPRLGKVTVNDYGTSLTQVTTLNALPLHEAGVIGMGVLIGMVDDGFNNYRVHLALKGIPVVATYDFVQRDSDVTLAPGEYFDQGMHGAATLSVIAGRDNGHILGAAYGVEVALAKTEVDSTETIQEEDKYVEGLEWLEGLGVDIITSSLGYIDWYTHAQLDGNTAITSRVAHTLAAKGVLLVTAMGNEGNYFPGPPGSNVSGTLIAPADADSILSVGATYSDGFLAGFSSTGPTADSRIKPEVVAQGTAITVANGGSVNGYFNWQGTSFSTPLTASCAALILSAHPDATPMQIRAALMQTASHFDDGTSMTATYPNNFYGWGHVDAKAAALSLGPVVSNIPLVQYLEPEGQPTLFVSVRVLSNVPIDSLALYYRHTADSVYVRVPFVPTGTVGLYATSVPVSGPSDTSYVAFLTLAEQAGPTVRRPAGSTFFSLRPTNDSIAALFPPPADSPIPAQYVLAANYPNPFNAGTHFLFRAPAVEDVELAVFDLLGRRVRTLFRGPCVAGTNTVAWSDLRDESGRALASGTYLYRLRTPRGVQAGRLLLLK